ncbi:MAG: hypothetical protein QG675_666 [Patescibacteria group bacterium]|jgi:hypothetical protein|nr:hypothetical protein [Patescibacteria group bacterium]
MKRAPANVGALWCGDPLEFRDTREVRCRMSPGVGTFFKWVFLFH